MTEATGATRELIAAAIFLATYFVFAVGSVPGFRIDRTGAAIIGAGLVVVTGVLPMPQAVAAVDASTIVLLFGMMIVAAYLDLSGFFALVTAWAISRARSALGLLVAVVAAAGVLSAFFVNDIVCLVLTPLVVQIVVGLGLNPVPYLIALATASNLGSVATITGNPQNMIVGSLSGISYGAFLSALAPVAVVGLALDAAVIAWVYRRELRQPLAAAPAAGRLKVHRPLMTKSLIVTGGMLLAFFAGYPVPLAAIGAAAALLITRRVRPTRVYGEIDFGLLVLFTGLFIVIGAVEATGLADEAFRLARHLSLDHPLVLSAVTVALSNLVSNVPAVLLFKSVIPTFPAPREAWLLLAMASTLAGNLTIVGSVANL
ncbi:MAG TPA: SLC13 family permease, partial [Methylomirabilota bacterium]|nr:SLC13 family permease [Methylomirabilota bacterium]